MHRSRQVSAALVNEIAREGFLHALEILQLIEVMQRQNLLRINAHLSDAGAGRAGIAVRNSLIARITLLVAGSFAPARDGDKHIRRAFDILENHPNIRAEVERQGSKEALAKAVHLWEKLTNDPKLEMVKHFRDKHTAHVAEPRAGVPIPSYDEFFVFAKATAGVMEKLAHGVGGTTDTLDEMRDEMANSAQKFWSPWEAPPKRNA